MNKWLMQRVGKGWLSTTRNRQRSGPWSAAKLPKTSRIAWIQQPDPTLPGDKPCERVTQLIQGPGHTSPGEKPWKKRNSMRLIPGRVLTLLGERRWKPQGNWASQVPAQT